MKAVAEFAVANHRTVSQMLDGVTLKRQNGDLLVVSDPNAVQGAIDWLKQSPYRERDRKADIGTAVHEVVEAYVKRRPVPTPIGGTEGYVAAFQQFLEDWKPRYELAEASVYNRKLHYAGTLDAICEIDGLGELGKTAKIMLDYKTTGAGVYPEAALQLSAYRFAEFIGMPDGTEAPMPAVDGCAVVWLKPEGEYALVPVIADERTFTSFRYVQETFRWAEEISKGVIGQPLPAPKKEEHEPAA
jgi:hypothetical protein